MVQDIGGLDHLHHEGGLPGVDFILCPDAREDAIYQPDVG